MALRPNWFSPLFTDLYQLTMAQAYFEAGKAYEEATFELFFRRCPFRGEFAVASGHALVREILDHFHFSEQDLEYLKSLPNFKDASPTFFQALKNLDLIDVDIDGVHEGELVFSRVPILQVRGPVFKVQLLESALLNAINFSTLVATYARRIRLVAPHKKLLEFGMRRAQGPNGAMTASRAAYLGGFDATTNVLAAQEYRIPVVGTMAHSYVQSFNDIPRESLHWRSGPVEADLKRLATADGFSTNPGELGAFLSYAKVFPDQSAFLVDTYDVLKSGVPNAIRVFKLLKSRGHAPMGIRLDSGDLVYLSREARRMLDENDLKECAIVASNELDETIIESLQDQGAMIDSYGVGTQLVTAAEQPALGGVFKLVELSGRPRMKISEQTAKLVLPASKSVYRLFGRDGKMLLDLLATRSEIPPQAGAEILALHPSDTFKRAIVTPTRVQELLVPLFRKGKWLSDQSLVDRRTQSLENMNHLRSDILRRANPTPYKVSVTPTLKTLLDELYQRERPPTRLE